MKVIVDTSVWSEGLRRREKQDHSLVLDLTELIQEGRVQLLGVIRQEILSGIKDRQQFLKLRRFLRAFADLPVSCEDFEMAAEFFNLCRKKGIQGSNADFLICAISMRHKMEILTSDHDFKNFAKILPIKLYL